ncbi:CRAL-TRIO lipid binding domain [Trypanosoma melophagium]|uniref:CRAL-TRIO lipid binding domain n=1 Tax=Trypanosoma melophagium TaxID=715481 RepID=UPI00351A5F61|nr:CRAL-TRIO lipid binding domain [Trypanosoma melophagium]
MTKPNEDVNDIFLLDERQRQETLHISPAADALVLELLQRIAQYTSDGEINEKIGNRERSHSAHGSSIIIHNDNSSNNDNISNNNNNKGNGVESRAVSSEMVASFEYFPQFKNCVDADARYILAQKFLMANRYKLDDAMEMVLNTNTFRKQHKLDSIVLFPSLIPLRGFTNEKICDALKLPTADVVVEAKTTVDGTSGSPSEYLNNHPILQPIFDLVGDYYASSIHYWDKEGRPVMYGRLQHVKAKEMYRDLERITPLRQQPENLVLLYHLYGNELLGKIVQYSDHVREEEKKMGVIGSADRITTATIVIDCNGIRTRDLMGSSFRKILQGIIKLDQKHYPEVIHRFFLVNCCGSISFTHWLITLFGMVKQGLRRKIICVNKKKTPEVLASIIDKDRIPEFLGGLCSCPGGCVPFNSMVSEKESSTITTTSTTSSSTSVPGTVNTPQTLNAESISRAEGLCLTPASNNNENSLRCDGTQNLTLRPRQKHTVSYNMEPYEDITWEFAVKRGKVGFTAVFIECSSDGHTEVLSAATQVTDSADHYVSNTHGALILTWDNTQSLFIGRQIQLRVYNSRRLSESISP